VDANRMLRFRIDLSLGRLAEILLETVPRKTELTLRDRRRMETMLKAFSYE
jgi:hypothetical protein